MINILLLQNTVCGNGVIDFSNRNIEGYAIKQANIYKEDICPFGKKVLRRINTYFAKISLGDWKKSKEKYDVLIIMESDATVEVLKAIKRLDISSTKILYFMNSVTKINKKLLDHAKKLGYIIATYNLKDSIQYNINYVHQCWNPELIPSNMFMEQDRNVDLFFVGKAKNRYDSLIGLKRMAEKVGLTTKFIIISDKKKPGTQKEEIPYAQCLSQMKYTKVIVDIVGEGNIGLTWRPLEALFMKKKLLTNYREIEKYELYQENKANIFIIGKDNINKLYDFVKSPYVDKNLDLSKYDIENWLKKLVRLGVKKINSNNIIIN